MRHRLLSVLLSHRLRAFPAVALVGPRQCGKTTLAKTLSTRYFDLESPPDRLRLDLGWDRETASGSPLVLDEAQSWPEVFPRLRGAIDRAPGRRGRFLLLGSVSPALMRNVSESLAGRLSLVELTPFLSEELPEGRQDECWIKGGYPRGGVLGGKAFPQWQRDFLSLLAQRDLPSWGLPAKPEVTERLFRMSAALQGQLWNASAVGRALGLAYHTVNTYMEFLKGAFLVRSLPSLEASVKKRLVKSPKVYWRDSGLLHALMGASDRDEILSRPWVGASWEGWVIEQILGSLSSRGILHEAFHFRAADGEGIDLVVDAGGKRWAVEIKLTTSPSPHDARILAGKAEKIGAERAVLLSRAARTDEGDRVLSTNLAGLLKRMT